MILLFTNQLRNIELQLEEELGGIKSPPIQDLPPPLKQTVLAFYTPHEQPSPTCSYPMNVADLFPFWLRQNVEGESKLILMTKAYYNWLSCGMSSNDISFFNLEDLIDIETTPDRLLKYHLYSYINSFPVDDILTTDTPQGNIDPAAVRKLFDNVKINLYSKKGTEESIRFVLESLFNITPDRVSVSYPKRYIMRLNGGHYDWMRDDLQIRSTYSSNPNSYNPQLVGSFLNYSVLQDNELWQEYSYVLNITGLSAGYYENAVKPLVHPAGTKDFYDAMHDVFNNTSDSTSNIFVEIPVIKNYANYNLFSFDSLNVCSGCSGSSDNPGPQFRFPTWDVDINTKYSVGVTFGAIKAVDFLRLSPATGFTFVNETLSCIGC